MAVSLRIMYQRELSRASHGHYKNHPSTALWVLFLAVTFASFAGIAIYGYPGVLLWWDHLTELSFFTLALPLLIYVMLRLSLVMRWVLYWLLISTALLVFLNSNQRLVHLDEESTKIASQWIVIIFCILELLTIATYSVSRSLWPRLIIFATKKNPLGWWTVQRIPHKPSVYYAVGRLFGTKKRFSYVGEKDDEGLPHGFGKWTSEWQRGEILQGLWEHGYPVGPFRSREFQTGYSFENRRIGFIASVDSFNTKTFKHTHLHYGLASVEASVSGKFFSDLPNAELIMDPFGNPSPRLTLQDVVNHMHHYSDFSQTRNHSHSDTRISITCSSRGFLIAGYEPQENQLRENVQLIFNPIPSASSSQTDLNAVDFHVPRFIVKGWSRQRQVSEILLFIPGFNSTVRGSLENLGQMLGLGNLPSHIKPFTFNWPGGNLYQFPKAVTVSESPRVLQDFKTILKNFIAHGFTKIHLVSHSMGARIVCQAASAGIFKEVFAKPSVRPSMETVLVSDSADTPRLELCSVTFLSPETPLRAFVEEQFDEIRTFSPLVTMYGSRSDLALRSAEILHERAPLLGLHVDRLYRDSYLGHNLFFRNDEESLDNERMLLDIDVIDATNLDSNVRLDKHSYFALNKMLIDDLMEVIASQTRAMYREHRLLSVGSNVYSFIAAPSFVTQG
ncbi:hypothetical protein HDU91_004942 [Kappamyces sp. JEL0680]|nr:hypothetical protein HDU91_004942 [Kappamyces sp. JEL0680]